VDAKGRVSLPSDFRKVLENIGSSHVVILPQMKHPDYHVVLSQTGYDKVIEQFEEEERDPDEIEAMAQVIQTNARQIPFDDVGRMVLSRDLREMIGLVDEVRFVGRGSTFQIWEPGKHTAYGCALAGCTDERRWGNGFARGPAHPRPSRGSDGGAGADRRRCLHRRYLRRGGI
jgi:MraZ protein